MANRAATVSILHLAVYYNTQQVQNEERSPYQCCFMPTDSMDVTFLELRCKEVINIIDGKRLGRIIDILFECKTGKICGLIVPGDRSLNIFRRSEDILVPWKNILRVGEDVILVELFLGGYRGGGPKNQKRLYEGEIVEEDYIREKFEKQ